MAFDENERFYRDLGSNIRKIRELKKISQVALAEALSLNRTSITNIENGKQRILVHTLCQMAVFMKVEISNLIPSMKSEQTAEESIDLFGARFKSPETINKIQSFVDSQKRLNA